MFSVLNGWCLPFTPSSPYRWHKSQTQHPLCGVSGHVMELAGHKADKNLAVQFRVSCGWMDYESEEAVDWCWGEFWLEGLAAPFGAQSGVDRTLLGRELCPEQAALGPQRHCAPRFHSFSNVTAACTAVHMKPTLFWGQAPLPNPPFRKKMLINNDQLNECYVPKSFQTLFYLTFLKILFIYF